MNKRLNSHWKPDFWFFTKLFVILAMCLFIVYPFYTIITKSVFSSKVEGVTLYNFKRFFTKPYYYQTLLRSMVVCFSTVLTTNAGWRSHRLSDYPLQHSGQEDSAHFHHHEPDESSLHRCLFLDHPAGS